jgi:6-phosphogluconolactonase
MADSQLIPVYVGTYTHSTSEGIYRLMLDPASGALTPAGVTANVIHPSFLAFTPDYRFLFAANETTEHHGEPTGAVSAFAVDPHSGDLTFLNQQPSHGEAPCHLDVDDTGRYLLAANYGTGSISAFPIGADGQLGAASDIVQHEGGSINPNRQQGPHAHSITVDPHNRFAFVADLGMDKVMIYRLDLEAGELIPNDPPSVSVTAGHGPRHFDFHPNGRYAYLINEIGSTMTAFAYDGERGSLQELETVSTLPTGFSGNNSTADVHVHPNGRFLYGSNRGHNSIVIYAIDEATGKLSLVGHESTQGETPRNFAIDPTGTLLLAANQRTDNIITFRIDQSTGKLTSTGHSASVPMPVCLKMIPLGG